MKKRVLVIDDDHLVADTLTMVFLANGYESEAVYSTADALARARTFLPGLLLCDVSVGDENGLQLADSVHTEIPDCKVLMLTAYASNVAKVEEHGSQTQRPLRLINKPCRPELILEEAAQLLQTA